MLGLFGNRQESNLRSCVTMVEDALLALGHEPDDTRLDTRDASAAWRFQKGSAHVYVLLQAHGDTNLLRVVAPVLHLTPQVDERRLFRRLLELNGTRVSGVAFGLRGDDVVLAAERSTVDLDASEVLDLVRRVEHFADAYDDVLVSEFGGRTTGVSSAPVK